MTDCERHRREALLGGSGGMFPQKKKLQKGDTNGAFLVHILLQLLNYAT